MSIFRRAGTKWWTIQVFHPRAPKGGLTLQARTTRKGEAEERDRALLTALDWGVKDLVPRLRARVGAPGRLTLVDLVAAVKEGSQDALAPPAAEIPMLGASCGRTLQAVTTLRRRSQERYAETFRQLEAFMGVRRGEGKGGAPGEILEDVPLLAITLDRAQDFLLGPKEECGGNPWAANTRILKKAFIQRMYDDAITRERMAARAEGRKPLLEDNPFRAVEVGEAELTRHVWLPFERVLELIEANRGTPHCAWVAVGALGGLRSGERINLRTKTDLELIPGRPRIRVQPRDGAREWFPKSKQGLRDVPIGAELLELLLEHVDLGFAGETYFFRSWNRDVPMDEDTAREWTKTAFARAGIPYGRASKETFTDHSLRHTFGSLLAKMNVHPKRGAKLMGITVQQYMKTYLHLAEDDDEAAVAMLDAGLASARLRRNTRESGSV